VGSFAVGIGLALAACSLFLVIGVTLVSVLDSDMPALTGYAATANATMYSYVNASYSSMSLGSVLPILLFAALIISLVIGGCMFIGKSGFFSVPSPVTGEMSVDY
jgi:1,4-dihydroxy-2-naphthoate octaprenyltransferase